MGDTVTLTFNTSTGASSNVTVTWLIAPRQEPEPPAAVREPRRPFPGAPPVLVAHREPDGGWAVA